MSKKVTVFGADWTCGKCGHTNPGALEDCQYCNSKGESHPTPSPDLLLTERANIPDVDNLISNLNDALGMCSERSPRWRRVVISLEELLNKLEYVKVFSQQARPTEQAREKIAEELYKQYAKGVRDMAALSKSVIGLQTFQELPESRKELFYKDADQLRLLPDEQSIEKRVRKEIGEWLESLEKLPKDRAAYKIIQAIDSLKNGKGVQSGQMPEDTK